MPTLKSTFEKLLKRTKRVEKELESIKDFLRTIELKLKTSENHTKTIMKLIEAFEVYRYDGLDEAKYEVLTI